MTIKKLDYRIQSVLPQVYDDSLSHMELLNKVMITTNEVVEETNKYFNGEYIETHVGEKLDTWKDDGTMETIVNENVFGQLNQEIENIETKVESDITNLQTDVNEQFELNRTVYSMITEGADPTGATDNTTIFNNLVARIPEGSTIVFPKGTYKGHFISNKSLILDFQGSTLTNDNDVDPIIRIEGSENTPRLVTGNPVFAHNGFILSDVSSLKVGDIGYLYDASVRPNDSTPKINSELIKIKSITDNKIFVEDMIRSDLNTGSVYFVKMNKLDRTVIKNVVLKPTPTHYNHAVYLIGLENPIVENVYVEKFSRHGVRFQYCYRPIVRNVEFETARLVDSGQGYGLSFEGCRYGYGVNIKENKCRHAVDMSSTYLTEVEHVIMTADIYLSHNGYGGYNKARHVKATGNGSVVTVSKQGIANEDLVVARGYEVSDIDITIPDDQPDVYKAFIYFQSDYADIRIENVKITYVNATVDPNSSVLLRFNGTPKGSVTINNIRGNVIANVIRVDKRNATIAKDHIFSVDNVEFDKVLTMFLIRGLEYLTIGKFRAGTSLATTVSVVQFHTKPVRLVFDSLQRGSNVTYDVSAVTTVIGQ